MTKDEISNALEHSDWQVRYWAIQHPNVTSEHINKALKDSDDYVRYWAIQHPKVTSKHISKALNDLNLWFRKEIIIKVLFNGQQRN